MNKPTEKEVRDRRRSLKALATCGAIMAAGNLPHQWSKPVVESVMLPAHAETSTGPIFTGSVNLADAARHRNDEALAKVMNTLVPTAQAQAVETAKIKLAVLVGENNTYEFFLKGIEISPCKSGSVSSYSSLHTGTGVFGNPGNAPGKDCEQGNVSGTLRVVNNGDTLHATGAAGGLNFNMTLTPGGTIPRASACEYCFEPEIQ